MSTDHADAHMTAKEVKLGNASTLDVKQIEETTQEDIARIPNYEQMVLDAISETPKIRNGVQITDTTMCCRLKVFEIVKPKERTSQDNVLMSSGTALHRYMQKKISNPDPERYDIELPIEYKGYVFGSIDLYDKKLGIIIDIKTKVINGNWEVKPYSSQEEQLKDLMAIKDVSNGVLVLVLVGDGNNEPAKQFNYHMTKKERQEQLKNLEDKAKSFLIAKNKKDPYLAKYVFFDNRLKWLCHRPDRKTGKDIICPYYWDCFAMIKRERDENESNQSTTNDPLDADDGDGEG